VNQIADSDFWENYSKQLLNRALRRAKRLGITCDLTPEDLKALWSRCGGCCEVSGRPFSKDTYEDCQVPRPFAPSLDRINCQFGYTKTNTRLVCVAVNFALNEWGDDVYLELAEAAVAHGRAEELDRICQEWFGSREDALKTAEARVPGLVGDEKTRMLRHIAGLKAALCKGPTRAKAAARNAWATRKAQRRKRRSANGISPLAP
jgi:hypothetical protein